MNENDIERIKGEMISNLKNDIEDSLLEEFVENYENWVEKMNSVNAVISHVNPEIPIYTFNEFCKKIIDITKNALESNVEFESLFLTSEEYLKIAKETVGDEEDIEKAVVHEVTKKFMINLLSVLNKSQVKESVKHKLKDQFSYVEKELDKSLDVADEILKKFGEAEM